ncbi:MAG: UvrD-helicase domain-containing protein [Eubacterium sp.]
MMRINAEAKYSCRRCRRLWLLFLLKGNQRLTDNENPVDIDKLLIVTFINNAAAEMKSRITKSLKDILRNEPFNKNALRQQFNEQCANLPLLTDSFAHKTLSENFYRTWY